MKRLLVVAHQFPPAGGIGVQRILRFCRDLPLHGWRPVILTGYGTEYPLRDSALLQCLHPGLKVVRADLPMALKRYLPRLAPSGSNGGKGFFRKLGFRFWIYDDFYPWIFSAYLRGRRIMKDFSPDAVLATGSPFCSLIAADLIIGLRDVPLLVDFRDGWHECPYRRMRGSMPNRLEGILEQRILRRCRNAFFVTQGLVGQYRQKYPNLAHKFVWLPNGYETGNSHPENRPFPQPGNELRVKYIGQFTPYRRPDAFLRGLGKAVRNLGCADITVEFVGGLDHEAWRVIEAQDLVRFVKVTPFLPHEEAKTHAWSADVLLLLVDRSPGYRVIQTGKIFEYMPSRRPILCISPLDSEASQTVIRENLGIVVPPEDEEGIARALERWAHEKKTSGAVCPNSHALPRAYDQVGISTRLARYLDAGIRNSPDGTETAAQYA